MLFAIFGLLVGPRFRVWKLYSPQRVRHACHDPTGHTIRATEGCQHLWHPLCVCVCGGDCRGRRSTAPVAAGGTICHLCAVGLRAPSLSSSAVFGALCGAFCLCVRGCVGMGEAVRKIKSIKNLFYVGDPDTPRAVQLSWELESNSDWKRKTRV